MSDSTVHVEWTQDLQLPCTTCSTTTPFSSAKTPPVWRRLLLLATATVAISTSTSTALPSPSPLWRSVTAVLCDAEPRDVAIGVRGHPLGGGEMRGDDYDATALRLRRPTSDRMPLSAFALCLLCLCWLCPMASAVSASDASPASPASSPRGVVLSATDIPSPESPPGSFGSMVAWDPAWGEEDVDAPLYERQMARLKAFSQKPLKGLTCDGSPAISPSYHCSRSPPSQLSPRLLLPSVLCVHCGRSLCSAMLRCGGCGWWLKGWNSCGAFFWSVSEEEMRANVELTVQLLQPSGYSFIELDWYWYLDLNNATTYLDQFGRPQPDPNRWPNSTGLQGFTRLVEYIHGKGLMFGLHIMRGVSEVAVEYALPIEGTNYTAADVYDPDRICPWSCVPVSRFYATKKDHPASQPFYDSLLRQYAAWGVDLIKADCYYGDYYLLDQIEAVSDAIEHSGRPMLLSLSAGNGPNPSQREQALTVTPMANVSDAHSARQPRTHRTHGGCCGSGHGMSCEGCPLNGLLAHTPCALLRCFAAPPPLPTPSLSSRRYRMTEDTWADWRVWSIQNHWAAAYNIRDLLAGSHAGRYGLPAFPDFDNPPFGWLTDPYQGRVPHFMSPLTRDEQYTIAAFWMWARAPMFYEGDLVSRCSLALARTAGPDSVSMDDRDAPSSPAVRLLFRLHATPLTRLRFCPRVRACAADARPFLSGAGHQLSRPPHDGLQCQRDGAAVLGAQHLSVAQPVHSGRGAQLPGAVQHPRQRHSVAGGGHERRLVAGQPLLRAGGRSTPTAIPPARPASLTPPLTFRPLVAVSALPQLWNGSVTAEVSTLTVKLPPHGSALYIVYNCSHSRNGAGRAAEGEGGGKREEAQTATPIEGR